MHNSIDFTEIRTRYDAYCASMKNLYPGKCSFSPEMVAAIVKDCGYSKPSNEQLGQLEVFEFIRDCPDSYFAYVNEIKKEITTWMGDTLGNFKFLTNSSKPLIEVTAVNGKKYRGQYYKMSGDYCRLKVVK